MRANNPSYNFLNEFTRWQHYLKESAVPAWLGWALTFAVSVYLFVVITAKTNCYLAPSILWTPIGLMACFICVIACFNRLLSMNFCGCASLNMAPWKITVAVFCVQTAWLIYMGPQSVQDVDNQISQGDALRFNDWHPLLHTWILCILTRVCHSLWFLTITQIALFSILCAWAYKTVRSSGNPKLANVLFWFLLLNPANFALLRIPIKDTAFMLATFGSLICLINFNNDPNWGKKIGHQFLMGSLLFIATFVRHNGILFTAPLALLTPIFATQRRLRIYAYSIMAIFIVCSSSYLGLKSFLTRQGKYVTTRFEEGRESEKYGETVGLIMTGLSSFYFTSTDQIPNDIRDLMESLGANKCQNYKGDYNSLKFQVLDLTGRPPAAILSEKSTFPKLIGMLRASVSINSRATLDAIRNVTSLVWDPFPDAAWSFNTGTFDFRNCWPLHALSTKPFGWFFTSVGFWSFFIVAAIALGWIMKGKLVLSYTLPILCYNFGTMLLLCGNDWRFFYALVISSPLSIIGVSILPNIPKSNTTSENN